MATTVTTPETAMAAESTSTEAPAAESTPTEAAAAPAEVGIIVRNGQHGRALRRGKAL